MGLTQQLFTASRITCRLGGRRLINTGTTKCRQLTALYKTNSSSSHQWAAQLSIRGLSVSHSHCEASTYVRVPPMAESISEGTLNQFNKQVGEFVEKDEEIATIETDKIDVSVNAPQDGIIQRFLVAEGDTVTVDQNIVEIQPSSAPSSQKDDQGGSHQPEHKEGESLQSKPDHGDSSTLSVDHGKADNVATEPPAKEISERLHEGSSEAIASDIQQEAWYDHPFRSEKRVKMTRIRQRTAQILKESQNKAAFLTTFNEVDMSAAMALRKSHKDSVLEKHGVKLGYMGLMARASALALREIPAVNASIENNDTIVYRDYVDLNIAVAIPKGLVTPVVRNIESMNIVQIEKAIAELAGKGRQGKLTMGDLTGGTFTISNSGIWGSLFGTPILTTPQTAVLGTYGIQDRPVAVNKQVGIRPMMYVALTYDHRLIDGREAVLFLNLMKKYLESPDTMILE